MNFSIGCILVRSRRKDGVGVRGAFGVGSADGGEGHNVRIMKSFIERCDNLVVLNCR